VVSATTPDGQSQNSNQAYATPFIAGPTNLLAVPGNARVSLSWNDYTPLTNYNVKRATNVNGPWTTIATPITNSLVDQSVVVGTTYYYTVSAVNAGVETSNSNIVSATPIYPPFAPNQLTATAGNAQVALSWPYNNQTGVAEYFPTADTFNVKRSTTSGSGYVTIASIPALPGNYGGSYLDQSAQNGVTYYYMVTAVNSVGESNNSNEVSATPEFPPDEPTNLTAAPGNATVSLSWTASDSSDATGYQVERSTASGGPYTIVGTMETDPLTASSGQNWSYTDDGEGTENIDGTEGLENGTTYYYVVAAISTGGSGQVSNEASATPILPFPGQPDALTGQAGDGTAMLFWSGASDATSYNIYRSTSSGGPYALLASQSILTACTYQDTGLTNGCFYYYLVEGVNAAGTGPYSPMCAISPNAPTSSSSSIIVVAENYLSTVGISTSATPSALFPAPWITVEDKNTYNQPAWQVTFGSDYTLTVSDTNHRVVSFENEDIVNQQDSGPAGTALDPSVAISDLMGYLSATGEPMNEFGSPLALEDQIDYPATSARHLYQIAIPRMYSAVIPYLSDQVTALVEAETGAVMDMTILFQTKDPTSYNATISSDLAASAAATTLSSAGYSVLTMAPPFEAVTAPNSFWASGSASPTSDQGTVVWDCMAYDADGNTYSVWIDESTGMVVGGDVLNQLAGMTSLTGSRPRHGSAKFGESKLTVKKITAIRRSSRKGKILRTAKSKLRSPKMTSRSANGKHFKK
jgi:fibronectin type 3 domain-containing protein